MTTTNHQVFSSSNVMGLDLELDGMGVTIKAGPVVLAGISGSLGEDATSTLPVVAYIRDVRIYLVKDKNTDEFSILLDDFIRDGVDVRWFPNPNDTFDTLECVAQGTIPADATDLTVGAWQTWSITNGGA